MMVAHSPDDIVMGHSQFAQKQSLWAIQSANNQVKASQHKLQYTFAFAKNLSVSSILL